MERPAAGQAFEQLTSKYSNAPNVHYLYRTFLARNRPAEALEQDKMELTRSPTHVLARVQIAQELITQGDFEAAAPYAVEAARLGPKNFMARKSWGRSSCRRVTRRAPSRSWKPRGRSSPRARACASIWRVPTSAQGGRPTPPTSEPNSSGSRRCSRRSAALTRRASRRSHAEDCGSVYLRQYGRVWIGVVYGGRSGDRPHRACPQSL